jgi:hypothetical protein
MENDFKFSKDFAAAWNEARKIGNIDRMNDLFNELLSETGHPNTALDMSSAAAGKRAAEILNAQQSGTSFEGSAPGKKV